MVGVQTVQYLVTLCWQRCSLQQYSQKRRNPDDANRQRRCSIHRFLRWKRGGAESERNFGQVLREFSCPPMAPHVLWIFSWNHGDVTVFMPPCSVWLMYNYIIYLRSALLLFATRKWHRTLNILRWHHRRKWKPFDQQMLSDTQKSDPGSEEMLRMWCSDGQFWS